MFARWLIAIALVVAARPAHAEEEGQAGVAYGIAGAEVAAAGTVALHLFTSSSPGRGYGLALNFLPIAVGVGGGILAEVRDLDSRPALGFHGAVAGGTSLLLIGASIDGAKRGGRIGPVALSLGLLGAAGGAYLAAARVDTANEALVVGVVPFVGGFAGALTAAVAHFFDDQGPHSTRLLRYTGAGMLLGTTLSLAYAYKERGEPNAMKPRLARPLLSFGGAF